MDERTHRPVPRLPKPATVTASVGYSLAEATKKGIGLVAAVSGHIRSATPFRRSVAPSQGDRALLQLALLEAILCVPGHVEALVSQLAAAGLYSSWERDRGIEREREMFVIRGVPRPAQPAAFQVQQI